MTLAVMEWPTIIYMLMIVGMGIALYSSEGSHNGTRLKSLFLPVPMPYHYKQPLTYLLIGS